MIFWMIIKILDGHQKIIMMILMMIFWMMIFWWWFFWWSSKFWMIIKKSSSKKSSSKSWFWISDDVDITDLDKMIGGFWRWCCAFASQIAIVCNQNFHMKPVLFWKFYPCTIFLARFRADRVNFSSSFFRAQRGKQIAGTRMKIVVHPWRQLTEMRLRRDYKWLYTHPDDVWFISHSEILTTSP